MKEYKEIKVEETKFIPESITCNKCGKSEKLTGDEWQSNTFHSINLHFGYGSKFDMDIWKFDVCEDCLVEFVKSFKHEPEIQSEELY
jgi:hypothetical protein